MNWKNLILATSLIFNYLFAQNPTFDWAKPIGGIYNEHGNAIYIDKNEDVYTTGVFQGTVDFSPSPNTYTLVSQNGDDVFITKHNSSGNLLWAKCFGGTLNDYASSIKSDTIGNVYIAGYFRSLCDFDPGPGTFTLNANGNTDAFIVKLDGSGNFVWAKQFGSTGFEEIDALAVSLNGDVQVTGRFAGTVDFDPGAGTFNMTAVSASDMFVLKLNSAGTFIWAKQIDNSVGRGIDVSIQNDIYITGIFKPTADFDPGPATNILTSAGFSDAFVLKLNSTGGFVWVKQLEGGSMDDEEARAIKLDSIGGVYITGSYGFTVDFDPGAGVFNQTSNGGHDVYVWKLDLSGNFIWVKSFGGNSFESGYSIFTDKNNNIYAGGSFNDVVDFDPGAGTYTLSAPSAWSDGFIVKLSSNGNFNFAVPVTGIDEQSVSSLCIDTSLAVYSTGFFESITDFDPAATTFTYSAPNNSRDAFVLKLKPCAAPSNPVNTTPSLNQLICTGNSATLTASAATGTLNWYSSSSSTISLGSGTAFVTPTLSTGTYTYYVEVETCTTSISRTAITLTVSACAGINQMNIPESLAISVYPNPSSGEFFVNTQAPFEYEVIDLQGKRMKTGNFNSGSNVLELNELSNGMYFLKCLGNKTTKPIKLVVN